MARPHYQHYVIGWKSWGDCEEAGALGSASGVEGTSVEAFTGFSLRRTNCTWMSQKATITHYLQNIMDISGGTFKRPRKPQLEPTTAHCHHRCHRSYSIPGTVQWQDPACSLCHNPAGWIRSVNRRRITRIIWNRIDKLIAFSSVKLLFPHLHTLNVTTHESGTLTTFICVKHKALNTNAVFPASGSAISLEWVFMGLW